MSHYKCSPPGRDDFFCLVAAPSAEAAALAFTTLTAVDATTGKQISGQPELGQSIDVRVVQFDATAVNQPMRFVGPAETWRITNFEGELQLELVGVGARPAGFPAPRNLYPELN